MTEHQGVVETVHQNKAGFYSVKLPDGWYGTGTKTAPSLKQGDMIKFEYSMNGQYKNLDIKTLVKLDSAPAGDTQPKSTWVPEKDRQKSIIFQSSRKDAIEIIKTAQAAGCLALPTKKADQFDALLALVDELTVKLAVKATECNIDTDNNNNNNDGGFDE